MRKKKNPFKLFMGQPPGRTQFGKLRHPWVNNSVFDIWDEEGWDSRGRGTM